MPIRHIHTAFQPVFRRMRRVCASFLHSRKASVLPLVVLSIFVLIGAVGLAIDGGRLMMMHSSLQRAADAGGLSAVAKLNTKDLEAEVRKFTLINFAQGYVGATIDELTATLSDDEKTVTINATAT